MERACCINVVATLTPVTDDFEAGVVVPVASVVAEDVHLSDWTAWVFSLKD